jgi:hypothetical protein
VDVHGSPLGRFFGVVKRPATWLNFVYQWLAFPLGLFYFVFFAVGFSLGLGLVIIWVGIPILLLVAGAWWLFGAFERLQARYLLCVDVASSPRAWEDEEGVWGKLKAHFGTPATWLDLVFLFVKLPFGVVSTTLLGAGLGLAGWLLALPVFAALRTPVLDGTWIVPWWVAVFAVPGAVLAFVATLHVLNAWGWVCGRWALLLFGSDETGGEGRPNDEERPVLAEVER